MLTTLSIKNYALIDDIQVDFGNGFTIISGETGAGKSILLGGLSLILGKRADISSVKDSSKKCVIEAVFDIANYKLKPFFLEEDIDYDTETIVRREILPSGKSRAFINDSPVNLNALSHLGQQLLDIHSQHQNLELTDNSFQFQLIDALADNELNLKEYKAILKAYNSSSKELEKLIKSKSEAIKEYDYNAFLLKELDEANLTTEDLESLELEQETLSNVEDIKETLLKSYQLLNDDQIGVINTLTELKNNLKHVSNLSSVFTSIFERVESTLIEIEDVFSEVEGVKDNLEANPERLNEVNTKLSVIQNLLLKHSVNSLTDLVAIHKNLSQNLEVYDTIDDSILELQSKISGLEKELNIISSKIHENREKAIPSLVIKLQTMLADLGMKNAIFNIKVKLVNTFFSNGKDDLVFLFTANKGAQAKSLKQSASGGELSRIMLVIKSILSKYQKLPTIMFDEIDTGVSGEISNKMAAIMKQMSNGMQVFTITHLPQVAAKGDSHFKVYKEDTNDETLTHLVKLSDEERIVEIAQMLGGEKMSTSAIEHAKQLLN